MCVLSANINVKQKREDLIMNIKKKLIPFLLVVAMITSLTVPSFAEPAYTQEALKLQAIGIIAGGPEDLNLEGSVTRIQGLTFAMRAAGHEARIQAMTETEINQILSSWVDAPTYDNWVRKYAAFAIRERITLGVSTTEKRFSPNDLITGPQFLVFLLKSMGYGEATVDNAAEIAIAANVLTATQAVRYGLKSSLIRDDAALILYGAFKNGINKDGTRLIEAYIESGATTKEAAINAGFLEKTEVAFNASKASAKNLKEIVVDFTNELNPDTAQNKENYSVKEFTIDSVRLNEDKKSVTISLIGNMINQYEFEVTVKSGIKNSNGTYLPENKTFTGTAFDVTIPEAISAEQVGPTSFKVRFSEPVKTQNATFKFDDGLYFVSDIKSADYGYSLIVSLYTTIPEGQHKVTVSGVEDYVPYKCVTKNLTFTSVKDEAPPAIARVISVSSNKVELEFSKEITFVTGEATAISNIYHTNTANRPSNVIVSGNRLTLYFATNRLPNGTAYLTIGEGIFKDSWGNKNLEIKDLPVTVQLDRTKPVVTSIKAETDKKIVIDFSEDIEVGTGRFVLLDPTGKDVTSEHSMATSFGNAKVTLTFAKSLSGSSYSVVIQGVKDLAGNEIDKVTKSVAITDTTPPLVSKGELYKTKKIIKITFNEAMNISDIMNLSNYQWGGLDLSKTKATISLAEDGKSVFIDYSKETTLSDYNNILYVGRVRDASGNYIANFSNPVELRDMDLYGITIESVEATGVKTITVTLSDTLVNFVPADFLINGEQLSKYITNLGYSVNAEGKGVITFSLKDELPTDLNGVSIIVSTLNNSSEIKSNNSFGVKLAAFTSKSAVDKIPPSFTAVFTASDTIRIDFSESVNPTTLSKYTFTVSGNKVKNIAIAPNNKSMTLTLDTAVSWGTKVTLSQVHEFEDVLGNAAKGLSVEITYN